METKKLARIRRIGHRSTETGASESQEPDGSSFTCVDDHTRLAYVEMHPSETAEISTAFFRRAVAWFRKLGVHPERVLTDNARCYSSHAFRELCSTEGIRQLFTRPYRPQTNGKAERFIQTLLRRWAYRSPAPGKLVTRRRAVGCIPR